MVDINVVTENSFFMIYTFCLECHRLHESHFSGCRNGDMVWREGGLTRALADLGFVYILFDDYKLMFLRTYPLCFPQSNFFAALDDSDNEGKAPPAPVIATKKTKAAPPPKPEVVEPSKVVDRRP